MTTSPITAPVAASAVTSTVRSGLPANTQLPAALAAASSTAPEADQVSLEHTAFLRAELDRQPEIRADVVARARALAADPSYPPMETLRAIASQILSSPDLSEDVS